MSVIGIALLAAFGSTQPNVTSATGDWSNIPLVSKRNDTYGTAYMLQALEKVVRTGECSIQGVTRHQIKLDLPFLIQFDSSGRAANVVVHKLDCPAAEAALANAVRILAERGEYRPTGENLTGWYRGAFNVRSAGY